MESGSEAENRKERKRRFSEKFQLQDQRRRIRRVAEIKLQQEKEEGNFQQQKEGNVVDVRLIHEAVGRDLKCNSCKHHVPRSLKLSILCRNYSPHAPRPYRCFTICPNCFVEWELWPNNRYADSFDVLSGATYQQEKEEGNLQQEKEEGNLQQQKEGNVVDFRVIHKPVGRDLKCNSCRHHVPRSLKLSILCRKYSPHGPPGTRPYRWFTSCPNCFDKWELWPNNHYADCFDVLSGATYQDIIPEPNPDSNLGGEGQI